MQKRLRGGNHLPEYRGRQTGVDERAIDAGFPLWWRHAETGPEVDTLGAGQHRIEQQRRKKQPIGNSRRVIANLQISRRAFFANRQTAFTRLLRLQVVLPRRRDARLDRPELTLCTPQDIVRVDISPR